MERYSELHSGENSLKHKPLPPLSEEEQEERLRRLEAEHAAYIKNIATMRHLPRLQSTIAGAGGKTNAMVRIAEEQERERLDKLHSAAQKMEEQIASRMAHDAKVNRLEEIQSKKRAKRAAKKTRKKIKKEENEVTKEKCNINDDDDNYDDDNDDDSNHGNNCIITTEDEKEEKYNSDKRKSDENGSDDRV